MARKSRRGASRSVGTSKRGIRFLRRSAETEKLEKEAMLYDQTFRFIIEKVVNILEDQDLITERLKLYSMANLTNEQLKALSKVIEIEEKKGGPMSDEKYNKIMSDPDCNDAIVKLVAAFHTMLLHHGNKGR